MSMSVTLYQGAKVNGTTRAGLWGSVTEQKDYFDSLPNIRYTTGTVKLGEPLRLNDSINSIMSYSYGSIDYGDGFRYYFTIQDMQMVTETLTDVYYTVDCYETLVVQKPFSYGRAHITRYPVRIGKPSLTYDPNIVTGLTKVNPLYNDKYNLIAIAWDSINNEYKTVVIPTGNTHAITLQKFFNGDWYSYMKTSFPSTMPLASDIITTAIIPGTVYNGSIDNPITDCIIYESLNENMIVLLKSFLDIDDDYITISSDETQITTIKDMRGNDVFTVPIGHSYNLIGVGADILLNLSTISVQIYYMIGANIDYLKIPCESVPWNVDSFAEYNARQREIDIETRNLQNEKALVEGLANAVTSAGTGAIMGGIGGSAGAGAIAGGLSAVGGSVISYLVNSAYADKEQSIIDKSYRYANDYLANVGGFSYNECIRKRQGVYNIEYDSKTSNLNDIAVNGYPVSFPVDDFSNYIRTGKIKADVEINDISNQAWKEQIQARFSNGLMIV